MFKKIFVIMVLVSATAFSQAYTAFKFIPRHSVSLTANQNVAARALLTTTPTVLAGTDTTEWLTFTGSAASDTLLDLVVYSNRLTDSVQYFVTWQFGAGNKPLPPTKLMTDSISNHVLASNVRGYNGKGYNGFFLRSPGASQVRAIVAVSRGTGYMTPTTRGTYSAGVVTRMKVASK
jgi:hypothetical protein